MTELDTPQMGQFTTAENIRRWLGKGRYLNLKNLPVGSEIVGAVVHDEMEALNRALEKSKEYDVENLDVGNRFRAGIVRSGNRCILLVGTGMGCTGPSIIVYELSLLGHQIPILKIGTCVSVHNLKGVGTVFVPRWAVADEGVAAWDKRVFRTNHNLDDEVREVFQNKIAVCASQPLHERWNDHLAMRQKLWGNLGGSFANYETAVWSSDSFYSLMQRPDFFGRLAEGHLIQIGASQLRSNEFQWVVKEIKQGSDGGALLTAWDMECSALFSAGEAMKMQVAAALVISYSSEQCSGIGFHGETGRAKEEGEMAHAIEDTLVVEAVRFLLP